MAVTALRELAHTAELAHIRALHPLLECVQDIVYSELRRPSFQRLLEVPIESSVVEAMEILRRLLLKALLREVLCQLDTPAIVARGNRDRDVQGRLLAGGGLMQVATRDVEHIVGLHGKLHENVPQHLLSSGTGASFPTISSV
eukprot:CAMPEP_0180822230 /NCGR_PEP_ID=MMETSP1038_2-20121128/71257_1 /TAXON_ID=632150 /ORGANISM="Azadinium spinosum, Strain 3D9" /LENGTH=142 /DNA_ID=CAMNT_0022864473 /DNA_START=11 /DNA_END=440 /DNA_ORIENTATION=-